MRITLAVADKALSDPFSVKTSRVKLYLLMALLHKESRKTPSLTGSNHQIWAVHPTNLLIFKVPGKEQ